MSNLEDRMEERGRGELPKRFAPSTESIVEQFDRDWRGLYAGLALAVGAPTIICVLFPFY